MIDLRPATMRDADNLFAWRNDPVTCANSRSTAAVPREDHDLWMQFNVQQGYPQHLVLIADTESGSAGVVRFDAARRDVMIYAVSITIAPQHRGKGLSRSILAEACGYMPEFTLTAEVRQQNATSRRLFSSCGFEESGSEGGFLNFKKEPVT